MAREAESGTNEAPPSAGLRTSGAANYLHVASRIFNTPLLIDAGKLAAIVEGLRGHIGIGIELPVGYTRQPQAFDPNWEDFDYGSYLTVSEGIAVLEIAGTLVHKGAWLGSYSGLVSYDGISQQLAVVRRGLSEGKIGSLLLNVHTHGGEVAGCFDLADEIFAMRDLLPVKAVVADAACSAGYAIASAADEVVMTQTGYSGSIGVVYTHYDYRKYAEKMGVGVTHIYAGKEKVLGSPFVELSKEDQKKIQMEIDGLYEIFVAKAARNRNLDPQAVRGTEAAVFYAEESVRQGLADRIMHPRELLAEMQEELKTRGAGSLRQFNQQELSMFNRETKGAGATPEPAITQEQLQSERAAGKAEGVAEGRKTGATDERARVKAILGHAEAKERREAAINIACETDMSAEQAGQLLITLPKSAQGKADAFDAAMRGAAPGVSSEDHSTVEQPQPRLNANSIYDSRRKAAGHQ